MTPRETLAAERIMWRGAHMERRSRSLYNGLGENLEKPQTCHFCKLAGKRADGRPLCENCVLVRVFPIVAAEARRDADAACIPLFHRVKAVPKAVEEEANYIFRQIEEYLNLTAQTEMF